MNEIIKSTPKKGGGWERDGATKTSIKRKKVRKKNNIKKEIKQECPRCQCGLSLPRRYQELVKVSLSKRILDSSDAACKTYYFAFTCIKHLNPWLMVAISMEMMIATRWSKRTYLMCTLERARNVVMLIGIIIVCLDINHFWTYGVPKPGFACIYMEEFSENFKDWVWPAIDNTVELVLPVTIVTICFFLTAASMIRRPVSSRDQEVEMKNYFLELATLRDFSTICFILCLLFICLNVCRVTYTLTTIVSMIGYFEVDCPTLRGIKTVDVTLNYLFYSAKIYLYMAFSTMFRAKMRERFLNGRRKFQSCCRMVCMCGYKWAPVPPKDKCDDARIAPGQSKRDHPDASKSNKPTHSQTGHDKTGAHTSAHGDKDSYKSAPSKYDHVDAGDIGLKYSNNTEVSEFLREDSKRKHQAGASNDVKATKV
ncbi:unnamed protein product [Candidula unifasciata]|uniref:G-protein coupled receptors family 1 profile domain-containing protein n=1 Tax=Candidula unifasciata TaxID=100452 RepID=A0A8S3YL85_9EUPU|nr:unnamed protein product [Candidula unifasciata]